MILLAAVLATIAGAPQGPTLCIGEVCRAADVQPAVETVMEGAQAHKLTVATSDGARNVGATFTIHCGDKRWAWSLPKVPREALVLTRPAGDCTLAIRGEGYKAVEKALAGASLGVVYLHRLPVISGTVTDATTSVPIARADIFLPDGKVLATTDDGGRFRAAIEGPWPSRLRVEAAGRASRTVVVPRTVADVELPIPLARGGSIALSLAPPLGKEPIRWELRRVLDERTDEKVRAGSVPAGQSVVNIEGVDPGPYRVVVLGEEALQRFAAPVTVMDGTVAEAVVQIEPARLELEVLRGGKPFGDADLELVFETGTWRSKVFTDDEGRSVEEIWQQGSYLAAVPGWSQRRTLEGEESIAWQLDVPDRVVRGKLKDATTGNPLANAFVLLEVKSGESVVSRGAKTGADGSFEFKSVNAGTYSLTARLQGYQPRQTPATKLAEETHLETLDLTLQPVSGHVLRAVNAFGAPIAAAAVVLVSTQGSRSAGFTGEDGRITLPLSADERGLAFVVPRSGSFAMLRFASMAEEGAQELIVTVPEGAASLEVRAESTDGDPIGGLGFLMRINGVLLSEEVKEAMTQMQGLPHASDANGRLFWSRLPQGRYEIWPLASRADRLAVMSPSPPPAPVNVVLMAGHQVAKMVFRSVEAP